MVTLHLPLIDALSVDILCHLLLFSQQKYNQIIIIILDATTHWRSGPANQELASLHLSADRSEWSFNLIRGQYGQHVESPALIAFLVRVYCYKLVARRIHRNANLPPVPYCDRKFLPNGVRISAASHSRSWNRYALKRVGTEPRLTILQIPELSLLTSLYLSLRLASSHIQLYIPS